MTHSVFKPEYIEQARKLYKKGFTDYEVADFFEATVTTIMNWVVACPDFERARKDAKQAADREIVRALFWRAAPEELLPELIAALEAALPDLHILDSRLRDETEAAGNKYYGLRSLRLVEAALEKVGEV